MFFIAPFIVNALISVALSVAATLVQQIFAQDKKQDKAGVRGSIQTGGDNPLAFIMGRYATAGQLEYIGTWGKDGDTPNAYLTKVISVSDLPVRGLSGLFVGSERVTVLPDPGSPIFSFPIPITLPGFVGLGNPIKEYRIDGKDHLWIRFHDGNQTEVDPFLLSRFGNDPDRPWQSDMIGRGVAYVVITALVNREVFSGIPDYVIEVEGIPLNDRRGGTAQHDNPIVGIDTLLGGLSYQGQWVYGPQSISAARRPLAQWRPQMDKCDVLVDGEKAFRFGYEVTVDQEPHVVIGEYLKACEGRIAEIGGIYKVLVGGPDAPVVSFTDEDIVITEGQSLEPFPGLEATFNGISATYPEPAEAWENKEAPPRYRSDLELLDDNRRLPFSTSYAAVPHAVQVQRLMRAAIEETRRFRKHVQTMPPEWWEYEPLDAALWTSERNGYGNKVFLITAQDDLPNSNQVVSLQEQDPADYDWQSNYVLPWDVVPLVISRPEPQVMTGWNVAPYIVLDSNNVSRRPAIEVFWAAGLVDVRAVEVQVRESWAGKNIIFDGDLPYDPADLQPSAVPSIANLLPNTNYEVRGKYLPFSGRSTLWSNQSLDGNGNVVEGAWLSVLTPDVKLGADDVAIELGNVAKDVLDQLGLKPRQLIESFKQLGTLLEEVDRENYTKREALFREITVELEGLQASFTEVIEVALGPGGAISQKLESLYAAMGGNTAEVNVRWEAVAAPAGYSARYAIQAAANDGTFRSATFFLDVPVDPSQPTRIGFMAGQTAFFTSAGVPIALVTEEGKFRSANNAVLIDMITGAFSFGAP